MFNKGEQFIQFIHLINNKPVATGVKNTTGGARSFSRSVLVQGKRTGPHKEMREAFSVWTQSDTVSTGSTLIMVYHSRQWVCCYRVDASVIMQFHKPFSTMSG